MFAFVVSESIARSKAIVLYQIFLFFFDGRNFCCLMLCSQRQVSRTSHTYLKEVEYREEGGTPDVVGAVRLALAFKVKAAVGTALIKQREKAICQYVLFCPPL